MIEDDEAGDERSGAGATAALVAWVLVLAGLAGMVVLDQAMRRADHADLTPFDGAGAVFALGVVIAASLGAIVVRRTGNVVGWFMLGLAASVLGSGLAEAYTAYGVVVEPGSLPAADWVAPFSEALFWPAFAFLALILLHTPSGRIDSPGWRRFAAAIGAGSALWVLATLLSDQPLDPPLERVANPMAVPGAAAPVAVAEVVGVLLTHGGLVVAVVSIVRRTRRSTGAERQQLRWVGFGARVAAVAVVAAFASALAEQPALLGIAAAALVIVLPMTIAVAVTRYRLYDLDRLISRSLVLSTLTAAIAAVYVVVVAGLGLLPGDRGVASGIAAVVAALVVSPLRARAQRGVDRLLYGRRAEPFTVVSELNRRLQTSTSPEEALQVLAEVVASDLRLPYVAVETHDGATLASSGAADGRAVDRFALSHRGEDVGTLVLGLRRGEDRFEPGERALLEDLARHAGAAVDAAAVARDLQTARQRLVSTREEERRRLRRDLHDGLGPQLTAVTLKVDAARNLVPTDPAQADAVLAQLRTDLREAIDDIRRLVYALRPPGLDELGLLGALRQHVRGCDDGAAGIRIEVRGDDVDGLGAPVEVAAYRIATEAITNAVRHSRARRCDVRVALDGDLLVEVCDDGVGLPPRWRAGVGVTSMRERAQELGGDCRVEVVDGGGTRVVARLPVEVTA